MRRIPDDQDVPWVERREAAAARPLDGERHERIPIRRIVAVSPAPEVPPQIEVFELDPGTSLEIAGEQREKHIVPPMQDVEQFAYAGHDGFDTGMPSEMRIGRAASGPLDFLAQVRDVLIAKAREQWLVEREPGARSDVGQNAAIGPSRDRNARQTVRTGDQVCARAADRANAGTAGQHERAVDIEEDKLPAHGMFTNHMHADLQSRRGVCDMKVSNVPMTGIALALAGSVVLAQTPASQAPAGSGATAARADIKGEGISGSISLNERKPGVVEYTIQVKGLKPGLHGVHLHAVGKCEPDFAAAGGHFDPGPSGNSDPDANHPFHMGDIPNLEARADGSATLEGVTTRVTLSQGPLSLFDADGTAIIIHGNPDQGITGAPKSGVSGGPRIACGVISRQ